MTSFDPASINRDTNGKFAPGTTSATSADVLNDTSESLRSEVDAAMQEASGPMARHDHARTQALVHTVRDYFGDDVAGVRCRSVGTDGEWYVSEALDSDGQVMQFGTVGRSFGSMTDDTGDPELDSLFGQMEQQEPEISGFRLLGNPQNIPGVSDLSGPSDEREFTVTAE